MLETLLDPSSSSFVHGNHPFITTDHTLYQAEFFNTPWYFIQTGEPHLITFSPLSSDELAAQAMALNMSYRSLFPFGISLNVVEIIDENSCRVTTFERGVLRITASCGSGSTSAAVLANRLGLFSHSYIHVITTGGNLEIDLTNSSAVKKGPASIDFEQPSFINLRVNHE